MRDDEEGRNASKPIEVEHENDNEAYDITGIPNSHTIIHKPKLTIFKEKSRKYGFLMKQLSLLYYEGPKTGDTMLGFLASSVPQCGYSGISTIIIFIVGSVFCKCWP